jgi:antitoxin MazE
VNELALKDGDDIELTPVGDRRFEVSRNRRRQEALALMEELSRPLPPGFRFDRYEANER